jgi:hypothetical protein
LRFVQEFLGALLLAAISLAVLSVPSIVYCQQNNAISAAQSKIAQCNDAARAAESSGANISQLTTRLNSAGLLLSRAEVAYSNGDGGLAASLASQCQSELASFVSDANSLQASAAQSRTFEFLLYIVGSVVGTFVVIIGSFLVWRLLKRKYANGGGQTSGSDAV